MRKYILAFTFATLSAIACIAQSTAPGTSADAAAPASQASPIVPGRYEGAFETGGGRSTPIVLRILEGGGGLVDLPGQDLYGYPLAALAISGNHLAFLIGQGDGGSDGAIRFDAEVKDPASSPLFLEGSWSREGMGAGFRLAFVPAPATEDLALPVPVRGGVLKGSLLLPEGTGPFPLVVIDHYHSDCSGNCQHDSGKDFSYLKSSNGQK